MATSDLAHARKNLLRTYEYVKTHYVRAITYIQFI